MAGATESGGARPYIEHFDDAVRVVDDSRWLHVSVRVALSVLWIGLVWVLVRWIRREWARYRSERKVRAKGFEFEGRAAAFILAMLVGYGLFMVVFTPFFLFEMLT